MTQTAILYIADKCNLECVFCLEKETSWNSFESPETEEVMREIESLYTRGARHITFMGGETFFRKDLPGVIRFAKEVGFTRIGVTTNGTVISKRGFIQHLVAHGLDFIELSVHGHTPELTQTITQTHYAHPKQNIALKELAELGTLPTIVNLVVCEQNKDQVLDVCRYVANALGHTPLHIKLKMVSLQGRATQNAEEVGLLDLSEVDWLGIGKELSSRGISFWVDNLPLCYLGPYAHHSHETELMARDERFFDFDHYSDDGYYSSGYQLEGRIWPEKSCGACSLRPVCAGIEENRWGLNPNLPLTPQTQDPLEVLMNALALPDNLSPPEARERAEAAVKGLSLEERAKLRLEALKKEPRPSYYSRSKPRGHLRFLHPEVSEPVDVQVQATEEGKKGFFVGERLTLTYRSWSHSAVGESQGAVTLLKGISQLVSSLDAQGGTPEQARHALSRQPFPGWTVELPAEEKPKAPTLVPLRSRASQAPSPASSERA